MTPSTHSSEKKRTYKGFTVAAILYVLSVVAFSTWSYRQQQTLFMNHIDQSLYNAAAATEEILGRKYLQNAISNNTELNNVYVEKQAILNHYAKNCHFNILGVSVRQGTEHNPFILSYLTDEKDPHDPLPAKLSASLQALSPESPKKFIAQNINCPHCGELRVVFYYRALSADTGYTLLAARNIERENGFIMQGQAFRAVLKGLFLLAMAYPMIALFNLTQAKAARKMAEFNTQLKQDVKKQTEHAAELKDAIGDLERFNAVSVGREARIIELKSEVNVLLEQTNQPKRYNVEHID